MHRACPALPQPAVPLTHGSHMPLTHGSHMPLTHESCADELVGPLVCGEGQVAEVGRRAVKGPVEACVDHLLQADRQAGRQAGRHDYRQVGRQA